MQEENLWNCYFANPIVAAIRDARDLEVSLQSDVSAIFLLTGSLLNIQELVLQCQGRKYVFLHADLIEGLDNDLGAIKYLAGAVKPDGIISTRNNVIKYGKDLGLFTIQRYFCMDSLALQTSIRSIEQAAPDAIELLPGIIPRVVEYLTSQTKKPVIAGGMVTTKDDVLENLKKGAVAVSTSCKELWNI